MTTTLERRIMRSCLPRMTRKEVKDETEGVIAEPPSQAADIVEVLKKRIAFMSGGEDKEGNVLISVPPLRDDFMLQDFRDTVAYLKTLIQDDERGASIVIQGGDTCNATLDSLIDVSQEVLGDRLNWILVVHEDKKRDHVKKKRSSAKRRTQVKHVTKLFKFISPLQLTAEFGGTLQYDHYDWLSRQLAVEKYVREVSLLEKHADVALGSLQSLATSPGSLCIPQVMGPAMDEVIQCTVQSGKRLLDSLQCDAESGFKSHCGQRLVKERGNAFRKVKAALDSVLLLQRSFRKVCARQVEALENLQRLDSFFSETEKMIDWTSREGKQLSRAECVADIDGRNRKAMEVFGRYAKLRQFSASLCRDLPWEAESICSAMSRLDVACEDLVTQFDCRQDCLPPSLQQELQQFLQLLNSTELRLKKELEEDVVSTKDVDKLLMELQDTSYVVESQLAILEEAFSRHGESIAGEVLWLVEQHLSHIRALLTGRKRELLLAGQFLCCEENALQLVQWLDKLTEVVDKRARIAKTEHDRTDEMARGTYQYGLRLLDEAVRLRKRVNYSTFPSNRVADALFEAWAEYVNASRAAKQWDSTTK